jgi:hypothetical protein
VRSIRRLTVQEITEDISIGSCHDILMTELEMHRVVSEFITRLLTQDQEDGRFAICREILDRASENNYN